MVGEKDPYWDPVVDPIDTPPTISIRGTVAGQIFVDVNSRALYWKLDESGCEENCVENYSPLEAAWSASPPNNNWSIIVMENGLKQWAYKAHALYTAKSDYRSGDLTGRDEKLGWHAAVIQAPEALPEWVRLQETDMGPVVANEEGKTLYYIPDNRDRVLRETCNEKCVDENWTAVEAASNARPVGNWSVVELNGKRLWWYLGLPVYTYKNDLVPGDIFGEKFGAGAHGRAGWRAILSEKLVQNLVQYN
jgi:predicted lipoprotein with Yx(FWY)xxD motif